MAQRDARGIWKTGTGRGRHRPKGRALDDTALAEVRSLLGDRPRRRDLLIEHLHLIQDAHGHLSAAHLRALAEEMRLSQAEVYEVATFYAHFDVVREGEAPPPPLTLRVCDSLSCALAGAEDLRAALSRDLDPSRVRVLRAPCMGRCDGAPAAELGHRHIDRASPAAVQAALDAGEIQPLIPDYEPLADYREGGGYAALEQLRAGERAPGSLIDDLLASGLRGLGGAGFPTGRKIGLVRAAPAPRFLAVNGDEGEPGTFKDRFYLERRPHLVLEGMLIAAQAIEAARCYLYMRDEYPAVLEILRREIAALEAAGIAPPGYVELRRGAGAYICGEESAMIESIEGKRGLPRHRPPYVAEVGLFGRPTLVQNIETLHWLARICREGPQVYGAYGANGRKGLRSYSVSGRVALPGVYLLPAGSTLHDLIGAAGGMATGHELKAFQPGGPSSGLLPASLAGTPLDFDTLQPHGSFIGSAAVVVLSNADSAREAALNMMAFFADESCGQCTPCRVGCAKAAQLMAQERWDRELLGELCEVMADASICGLGQAAPNAIRLTIEHFPDEV
jgi:formate dehydrogenase beta subunit